MTKFEKAPTLQEIIFRLQKYWSEYGCVIVQPYDHEVGAGTFHPCTFFGVQGPDPWKVAYVQPSRRPTDGRYGDNPNRLYQHHQFQAIIKPSPVNAQEVYLKSLEAIGIDPRVHDLRFEEDDWESPTLGATGLGWQILCDGTEISQFTYFQQMAGFEMKPVTLELTYGLERIAAFVQGKDHVMDIEWTEGVTYRDMRKMFEYELSDYSFSHASVERHWQFFKQAETECKETLEAKIPYAAYEWLMNCSHWFNVLDARGAISVTQRTAFIGMIRSMALSCAKCYRVVKGIDKEEK
ncbi:glycine--tRNA ligase subunit alpha [bacterium]|nr:glycine--tRNA ligase subunit alpha [bacterium]MBR5946180.1 glycine--tRNA ligase subunit alpha [bacterium]MBR6461690.1 glycine--tRNA ligase subunit alpha [bacterium]